MAKSATLHVSASMAFLFLGFRCGWGCGGRDGANKGREGVVRDIIDFHRWSRRRHWCWRRIYRRGGGPHPSQSLLRLIWRSYAKSGFGFMGSHVPPFTLSDYHSQRLSHVDGRVCCDGTQPPRISVIILQFWLAHENYYAWLKDDAEVPASANWTTARAVTWSVQQNSETNREGILVEIKGSKIRTPK